jgi:hypothetical protein
MRKYLVIDEEAVSRIRLCNCSILNFLIYEEKKILFFFISVLYFIKNEQRYSFTRQSLFTVNVDVPDYTKKPRGEMSTC